mmetsp:Transcript_17603/g.42425  ORF Transcript_17603/g.42425 Transcript_17603/m.42425 type:complete len:267 (-) Transcript_17603:2723-3523(-)
MPPRRQSALARHPARLLCGGFIRGDNPGGGFRESLRHCRGRTRGSGGARPAQPAGEPQSLCGRRVGVQARQQYEPVRARQRNRRARRARAALRRAARAGGHRGRAGGHRLRPDRLAGGVRPTRTDHPRGVVPGAFRGRAHGARRRRAAGARHGAVVRPHVGRQKAQGRRPRGKARIRRGQRGAAPGRRRPVRMVGGSEAHRGRAQGPVGGCAGGARRARVCHRWARRSAGQCDEGADEGSHLRRDGGAGRRRARGCGGHVLGGGVP